MVLNEAFSSSILRELEKINQHEHYNILGEIEKPLSPIGAKFLTSLPLLWHKVSDSDIRMYADYDIFKKTPLGDSLKSAIKKGDDDDYTRNNLPSTVRNYSSDAEIFSRLSDIMAKVGIYSKDSIIKDSTRKEAFKGFLRGVADNIKYNSKPQTILDYIDKIGDISDIEKDLPFDTFKELKEIIEEYKSAYEKIKENNDIIKELGILSSLLNRIITTPKDTRKVADDIDESFKKLKSLYAFLPSMEWNDECTEAENQEILSSVDDEKTRLEEENWRLAKPGLGEVQRKRKDIYTDFDETAGLKYPKTSEFLDICKKDEMISDDDLMDLKADDRESYLTERKFRKLRSLILNRRYHLDLDKYEFSNTTDKVKLSGEDVTELRNYLTNKYTQMGGGNIFSIKKDSGGVKHSVYMGKNENPNKGKEESYKLLNSLYKNLRSSSIGSKVDVPGQSEQVKNNILSKIFKIDDKAINAIKKSSNPELPFNIVVLTDPYFRIRYVLSYYTPTEDPYLYKKSGDFRVLYGWQYGYGFDKNTIDRINSRIGKDITNEFDGLEYISDGKIKLSTIAKDPNVAIAIIIEGTNATTDDVVEDGASEISNYIYGKFTHGSSIEYSAGYNIESGNVTMHKETDGSSDLSKEIEAKEKEIDKAYSRFRASKREERGKYMEMINSLEDELKVLKSQHERKTKETISFDAMSKNAVRDALRKHGIDSVLDKESGDIIINVGDNEENANAIVDLIQDMQINGEVSVDTNTVDDKLSKIVSYNNDYRMFKDNDQTTTENIATYNKYAKKIFGLDESDIETISKKIYGSHIYYSPSNMQYYDMLFTHILYFKSDTTQGKKVSGYNTWKIDGTKEYTDLIESMNTGDSDLTSFSALCVKAAKLKGTQQASGYKSKIMSMIARAIGSFVYKNTGNSDDFTDESGMSVMKYVYLSTENEIDSLNTYLSSRIPFLKVAFNEAPKGSKLANYFYAHSAILANRLKRGNGTGSSDQIYRRYKDVVEPEGNSENIKFFKDGMNKIVSILDSIEIEPKKKKVSFRYSDAWNELKDDASKYGLPIDFKGYNEYFEVGRESGEWKIISDTKSLLEEIFRCVFNRGITDEATIENIYFDFTDYVSLVASALGEVSDIEFTDPSDEEKSKEEIKGKMAEAYNTIYKGRYNLINKLNSEYNLGVRRFI